MNRRDKKQAQYRLANLILDTARTLRLKAGHHFTEQWLADELSVSRTPVRSALRLLATRGVVDGRAPIRAFSSPGHGANSILSTCSRFRRRRRKPSIPPGAGHAGRGHRQFDHPGRTDTALSGQPRRPDADSRPHGRRGPDHPEQGPGLELSALARFRPCLAQQLRISPHDRAREHPSAGLFS